MMCWDDDGIPYEVSCRECEHPATGWLFGDYAVCDECAAKIAEEPEPEPEPITINGRTILPDPQCGWDGFNC